jgi:hypothetical protein
MKSSKTKIVTGCALAVAAVGLSAMAYLTPTSAQTQTEQWCPNNQGGTATCYPTLAQCEAANPGRACVKGRS